MKRVLCDWGGKFIFTQHEAQKKRRIKSVAFARKFVGAEGFERRSCRGATYENNIFPPRNPQYQKPSDAPKDDKACEARRMFWD